MFQGTVALEPISGAHQFSQGAFYVFIAIRRSSVGSRPVTYTAFSIVPPFCNFQVGLTWNCFWPMAIRGFY